MKVHTHKEYKIGDREYTHEDLALLAVAVACEKKAVRPVILDLRNLGHAFTEIFSIVSATNHRQVYAIAEEIRLFFKEHFDLNPVAVDGLESCTWVLLDYGFMFVHVFQEPTRELYQLEQLWSKARDIPATEEIFVPLYKSTIESIVAIKESEVMQDA
jgi:ribosome-associated protein